MSGISCQYKLRWNTRFIFLTEPKYYGEDSLKAGFSKDGLAIIDNFMKEPSEHDPSKTNWEYLCNSWNELSNNKISFPKTQPDYTATSEVVKGSDE